MHYAIYAVQQKQKFSFRVDKAFSSPSTILRIFVEKLFRLKTNLYVVLFKQPQS